MKNRTQPQFWSDREWEKENAPGTGCAIAIGVLAVGALFAILLLIGYIAAHGQQNHW